MFRKLFQQISEVFIGLQVIRSGCLCYAVSNGTGLCATDSIDQIPVMLAQAESANSAFGRVVVDWNIRIFQEDFQV